MKSGIARQAILRELKSRCDVVVYECSNSEGSHVPHEFDVAAQLRLLFSGAQVPDPFSQGRFNRAQQRFTGCEDQCDEVVAVITTIEDYQIMPPEISRWLIEFPDLIVIGIHWSSGKILTFRQMIEVRESGDSLSTIVNTIEQLLHHQTDERIA